MKNKDNEAMFEEIAEEAFIEERLDNEAMIEEVSDEVFIEERKPQPHTIYIKQPQHGLLLAYPPQAVAGETIGVRCNNNKPDEYKIKGINVITSNGVWRLGDQRTFQMPNSDVTLEAEFEKTSQYCSNCGKKYYKPTSVYCCYCGRKRI